MVGGGRSGRPPGNGHTLALRMRGAWPRPGARSVLYVVGGPSLRSQPGTPADLMGFRCQRGRYSWRQRFPQAMRMTRPPCKPGGDASTLPELQFASARPRCFLQMWIQHPERSCYPRAVKGPVARSTSSQHDRVSRSPMRSSESFSCDDSATLLQDQYGSVRLCQGGGFRAGPVEPAAARICRDAARVATSIALRRAHPRSEVQLGDLPA